MSETPTATDDCSRERAPSCLGWPSQVRHRRLASCPFRQCGTSCASSPRGRTVAWACAFLEARACAGRGLATAACLCKPVCDHATVTTGNATSVGGQAVALDGHGAVYIDVLVGAVAHVRGADPPVRRRFPTTPAVVGGYGPLILASNLLTPEARGLGSRDPGSGRRSGSRARGACRPPRGCVRTACRPRGGRARAGCRRPRSCARAALRRWCRCARTCALIVATVATARSCDDDDGDDERCHHGTDRPPEPLRCLPH